MIDVEGISIALLNKKTVCAKHQASVSDQKY
jgi:hypothetical protein